MRAWLVPSLTGALGLAVGLSFATIRDARHTAMESGVPVSTHPFAARLHGNDAGADRDVASEIEALALGSHAQAAATPEPTSAHSTAGAELPAFDARADDSLLTATAQYAIATVDAAIIRGSWTANDATILRAEFYSLPQARQLELLQSLIVAVNQDRVIVETEYFPF